MGLRIQMKLKTRNLGGGSKVLALMSLVAALIGCASQEPDLYTQPVLREPMRAEHEAKPEPVVESKNGANSEVRDSSVPVSPTREYRLESDDNDLASTLQGDLIEANFRNMPLPDFINEVFGRLLGFNFVLEPSLTGAQDLVTLSLSNPLSPSDLYRTARLVLSEYGVGILVSEQLLRFRRDNSAAQDLPLLVTGGALPDVPATKRTVFSFVTLEVVRNGQVRSWLQQLYGGTALQVREDGDRNAIVLVGPVDLVKQATETTKLLDQVFMKGKFSRSFTPRYLSARALTQDLSNILSAEGYTVSQRPPTGSVLIVPLVSQERIIVFAGSEETLQHAIDWAYNLDEQKMEKVSEGFFSYEARSVTAEHIADLVQRLHGDQRFDRNSGEESSDNSRNRERTREPGRSGAVMLSADRSLVVDDNRNVLLFKGSGKQWREMLTLIEEIDKPIPMVLIDVLLAEITLSGQNESGVEWLFNGAGVESTSLTGSTLNGLGVGNSGLTLTFNSAGETRALVNAFYSNDRAVIRSSPKLLVKSGATASIEVGNDIPVITSNSQSTDTIGAPVIQTIQYRSTGVALEIEPIVQAGGLVDLTISQQLSEQTTSSASTVGGSPTILERQINTALALKDGGSVLLGGLISSSKSQGTQGIPGLGKVPVLGKLFRSDIESDTQSELLMLVSVYVISSHDHAVDLTNAVREQLTSE